MNQLRQSTLAALLMIYSRYLLGTAFVFASIVKIQGKRFTTGSGAEEPIRSAGHMFETFYASGLWWQCIGVCQLLAGALLATQRYARPGMLLFLPIMSNIFLMTITYDFKGTPYITGAMLAANLALIAWDWKTLKPLLGLPVSREEVAPTLTEQHPLWARAGLVMVACTIILRLVSHSILLWWCVMAAIALAVFFYWHHRRRKLILQV